VAKVNCSDWRRASVAARRGTVREIRDFAGGPVGTPSGRGAVLEDWQAYSLFERTCSRDYASQFKLYKLYTRAAAFRGH
jgi:hypothetical protein